MLPGIRRVLKVVGFMLLATCLIPWESTGNTHFSWDMLANARQLSQQLPVISLWLATVLALVFGFVPAGSGVRGLFALLGGGMMLGCFGGGILGSRPDALAGQGWRFALLFAAWLLGPAALILRAHHRRSRAARWLGTIAVLMHLVVFLVPVSGPLGDSVVPVVGLFKAFSGPTQGKIVAAIGLLTLVVGLLPLTAWRSAASRGFGAWIMLALPGLAIVAGTVIAAVQHDATDALIHEPLMLLVGVWLFCACALIAYGLASVLAKTQAPAGATA
jgi:hypothetical protein